MDTWLLRTVMEYKRKYSKYLKRLELFPNLSDSRTRRAMKKLGNVPEESSVIGLFTPKTMIPWKMDSLGVLFTNTRIIIKTSNVSVSSEYNNVIIKSVDYSFSNFEDSTLVFTNKQKVAITLVNNLQTMVCEFSPMQLFDAVTLEYLLFKFTNWSDQKVDIVENAVSHPLVNGLLEKDYSYNEKMFILLLGISAEEKEGIVEWFNGYLFTTYRLVKLE